METQKYTSNINSYREITSTKMKHSHLLVSVILPVINVHYGKTKGKNQKQKTKKTKKNQK